MNHITHIETESGNIPVGHAEFASASAYLGQDDDFVIEFIPREGVVSGGGNVVIDISCAEGTAKIELPVRLSFNYISGTKKYTIHSTNSSGLSFFLEWYVLGSGKHALNVYSDYSPLTDVRVHVVAQFQDYDVTIKTWRAFQDEYNDAVDEGDTYTISKIPETLGKEYYGTTLPAPGTQGRIFFLEVQDE